MLFHADLNGYVNSFLVDAAQVHQTFEFSQNELDRGRLKLINDYSKFSTILLMYSITHKQ